MRILSATRRSLLSAAGVLTLTTGAAAQTAPPDAPPPLPPGTTEPVVVTAPTTTTTTSAPILVQQPATRETVSERTTVPDYYLIGTGAILMGGTWLASGIVSASSTHQGDIHLWVPLAGPWMDFTDRGPLPGGNGRDAEMADRVFLVLDGVFQAVGTLEVVSGFLFPSTVIERRKTTSAAAGTGTFTPEIHLMPVSLGSGYGMGAVGRF